jgi:hypothetical protein
MKSHGRHAAPRTITLQSSLGALRSEPLTKAAQGTVILALVLGSVGAGAADSLASAGTGHQPTTVRLAPSVHPIRAHGIVYRPWMT